MIGAEAFQEILPKCESLIVGFKSDRKQRKNKGYYSGQ